MLKPHCPSCNQIYPGERCACQLDQRYLAPVCECGLPALELVVDELGEWPMCATCLERSRYGRSAPDQTHDRRANGQPTGDLVTEPVGDAPEQSSLEPYPFDLTYRQYQIAQLSHLTNQAIAKRLCLAEDTVKGHLKSIFRKMDVRSRYEIKHLLNGAATLADQEPDQPLPGSDPDPPSTPSVTILMTLPTGLDKFRKVLDYLTRPDQTTDGDDSEN